MHVNAAAGLLGSGVPAAAAAARVLTGRLGWQMAIHAIGDRTTEMCESGHT